MKKLIIFYSFEGSTKLLAEAIANAVDAEVLELKPKKEILKSRGFFKYIWGGKKVFLKEKPELENFEKDPEKYDIIFIGTPIWAWTYTPPVRSFLEKQLLRNKKIALFCTHEGNKGKIFEDIKKKIGEGNEFLGEKDFFKVSINKEKSSAEAADWAKKIISQIAME